MSGAGSDRTAELDALVGADGRLLVVQVASGLSATNEVWVADLRDGSIERPALRRLPLPEDGWTSAWPAPGGRLYLLTDAGAPAAASSSPTCHKTTCSHKTTCHTTCRRTTTRRRPRPARAR
ncbi:hypothetical protein ACFQQB_58255 [Nonomuraea rubra]|uniref:hypothetical protein n=1 Tax=Nonomuraea rubra TaxID=46180 RepID=UPI003610F1FF